MANFAAPTLFLALFIVAFATDSGAAAPLVFATTYCGGASSIAGVHVLSESLIRAGHRERLTIFSSANTSSNELRALRAIPLTTVVSAPEPQTYCPSIRQSVDGCRHLRLLLFSASSLPPSANVVHLAHDSVVLSTLAGLASAAPFSAVHATHFDGFALDTIVVRRDDALGQTLRAAFCAASGTDAEVLRTAVPPGLWSALDDAFGVPAEQLDSAWYRQKHVMPKVVRFADAPRPWRWWVTPHRFSLIAGAHWCAAAAHTPYECGWGRVGMQRTNETAPVPLSAPGQPAGASAAQKFAVLLSTYRRRTWRALVRHYAGMRVVSKVVLVWHNPDADPPSGGEFGGNVIVMRPRTDSLNNRFATPMEGLPEAVYVCDDDMWVMEKSLQHVFGVWRGNSRRLVGLFPRKWGNGEVRYSADISNGYNMVLTKGMFVHRAFLFMYERLLPGRVKAVVDRHKNCEDILMNIMVTRYTGMAPLHVLVEERILDLGHHDGISKRGAHFVTRSQCVGDIVGALGIDGWDPPMMFGSMSMRPLKNREIK